MPDKRLIDANALYDTICKYSELKDRSWPTWIENLINAARTVNAVEVVRCRECRNSQKLKTCADQVYCMVWKSNPRTDGHCYLGAKMDGGAE